MSFGLLLYRIVVWRIYSSCAFAFLSKYCCFFFSKCIFSFSTFLLRLYFSDLLSFCQKFWNIYVLLFWYVSDFLIFWICVFTIELFVLIYLGFCFIDGFWFFFFLFFVFFHFHSLFSFLFIDINLYFLILSDVFVEIFLRFCFLLFTYLYIYSFWFFLFFLMFSAFFVFYLWIRFKFIYLYFLTVSDFLNSSNKHFN